MYIFLLPSSASDGGDIEIELLTMVFSGQLYFEHPVLAYCRLNPVTDVILFVICLSLSLSPPLDNFY